MWTEEWPTEPGWYWFYGWASNTEYRFNPSKPRVRMVRVDRGSDTLFYTTNNRFMYKEEGCCGVWAQANPPELPELESAV